MSSGLSSPMSINRDDDDDAKITANDFKKPNSEVCQEKDLSFRISLQASILIFLVQLLLVAAHSILKHPDAVSISPNPIKQHYSHHGPLFTFKFLSFF
jgi:hypothetical protein